MHCALTIMAEARHGTHQGFHACDPEFQHATRPTLAIVNPGQEAGAMNMMRETSRSGSRHFCRRRRNARAPRPLMVSTTECRLLWVRIVRSALTSVLHNCTPRALILPCAVVRSFSGAMKSVKVESETVVERKVLRVQKRKVTT